MDPDELSRLWKSVTDGVVLSAAEASSRFDSALMQWSRSLGVRERKHITQVEVRREPDFTDFISLDDTRTKYFTNKTTTMWLDQDGEPLDEELVQRLKTIATEPDCLDLYRYVLDEWNDPTHSEGCQALLLPVNTCNCETDLFGTVVKDPCTECKTYTTHHELDEQGVCASCNASA